MIRKTLKRKDTFICFNLRKNPEVLKVCHSPLNEDTEENNRKVEIAPMMWIKT